MDINLFATVFIVFLAAGTVKGISGMGLPTISMALLSLLMPPAKAAILMVLPSLTTNIAQCIGPHWRSLLRQLWPLWLGLVLFTVFSPFGGVETAGKHATVFLGLVLAGYGVWGLLKPALPDGRKYAQWIGGAAGAISGIVSAATGVFVIPMVPYLQSLHLSKERFIQGLGISFMLATVALMTRIGIANVSEFAANIPGCAVAVSAAFIGLWIGVKARDRLNPLQFQRALYSVFVVLGMLMVSRAVFNA